MNKKKKWISLLNFEGDVFKIYTQHGYFDAYDIVDYKGCSVREGISGANVLAIYDGIENIRTSDGRLYDISREHSNAKPSRDALLFFLGMDPADPNFKHYSDLNLPEKNLTISFTLTNKQQARFDEWKDAIKKIYGDCGHFKWTVSPTEVDNSIEVWSSLTETRLDLKETY
jgi:hypothetical protein